MTSGGSLVDASHVAADESSKQTSPRSAFLKKLRVSLHCIDIHGMSGLERRQTGFDPTLRLRRTGIFGDALNETGHPQSMTSIERLVC